MARWTNEAVARSWKKRIAAQRRSGLSALAFCNQEGVSPKSFYAWRRRLQKKTEVVRFPLFVPVELPAGAPSTGGMRIELPGGAVVALPPNASQELVIAAIRAVLHAAGEPSAC
jgi:DNA-binding CsgD family transcriptional regulator